MKKSVFALLLAALVLSLAPLSAAGALTAQEIMEKVDARDDGDNMTATQEMVLIDKRGCKRVRQMKIFCKDKGNVILKLAFFLSPAEVKGAGFLTYDYYAGEKDDDQWLYLPALRKIKRIASSDKSSAFMGSDFSYADITRRVLDEWRFRLLKEADVRGHKVWLIEAIPVNPAVQDRYGYTKSVIFIRQDIFMPVRAVHWLKDGGKIKYMDIRRLEQINGIWIGTEIHMKTTKDKQTLHRTVLRVKDVKFNQDLDDKMFTVRRLEKGI